MLGAEKQLQAPLRYIDEFLGLSSAPMMLEVGYRALVVAGHSPASARAQASQRRREVVQ